MEVLPEEVFPQPKARSRFAVVGKRPVMAAQLVTVTASGGRQARTLFERLLSRRFSQRGQSASIVFSHSCTPWSSRLTHRHLCSPAPTRAGRRRVARMFASPGSFATARIANSINVPMSALAARVDEVRELAGDDRPLVVICHGGRSMQCAHSWRGGVSGAQSIRWRY